MKSQFAFPIPGVEAVMEPLMMEGGSFPISGCDLGCRSKRKLAAFPPSDHTQAWLLAVVAVFYISFEE